MDLELIDDLSDEALDAQLLALLSAEAAEATALPVLRRIEDAGPAPLSFAQRRLWFQRRFDGRDTALYNMTPALQLDGVLDVAALHGVLRAIVRRHEALRSRFRLAPGAEIASQVIVDEDTVPLLQASLPAEAMQDEARAQAWAEDWAREQAAQALDLEQGPLLRAALLRLAPERHLLLLVMHHIVSDGWSISVMLRELAAGYAALTAPHPPGSSDTSGSSNTTGSSSATGSHHPDSVSASPSAHVLAAAATPPSLPALPLRYTDYAHWQHAMRASGGFDSHVSFWKNHLRDAPVLCALPTDRPRPARQSYRGASWRCRIDAATTTGLRALGTHNRASLFMVLLAAFDVLLARTSGQNDICVGTPVANRPHPDLEPLIGFFVNTLVLRAQIDLAQSFEPFLRRVRDNTLDAFSHQDLPFDELVEALAPPRRLSHSPLFQVMLVLQNAPAAAVSLPGLRIAPLALPSDVAKFDLTLSLTEVDGALAAEFEYARDLFDESSIARMSRHWVRLLESIVAEPACALGDLALMPADEYERVVHQWNHTAREFPQPQWQVHEWIAFHAGHTPGQAALVSADAVHSWAWFSQAVNQLAQTLQQHGVGPQARVAICMERSFEWVVSAAAVLKTGAAYVPLDPAQPALRQSFILQDAQPALLLLRAGSAPVEAFDGQRTLYVELAAQSGDEELANSPANVAANVLVSPPANVPASPPASFPAFDPDRPAYVIYTSGSTGRPKGVVVTHRGLSNLAHAQAGAFQVEAGSRVLQFASPAFDASASELFMCWVTGAALCIAPRQALRPGAELRATLTGLGITVATLPPVAVLQGGLLPEQVPLLRTLITAGEPCPPALVAQWADKLRLVNAYGPTEASVCATLHVCSTHDANGVEPPIGKPIANVQVYVLDTRGHPVPPGVAGELHIAGPGLAQGYLGQAGLTAEKFITSSRLPAAGRLYRTGDAARYREDGSIEFLGRLDNQIKLRGMRIEPGEVEAALLAQAGVREAHAMVREDRPGDRRLVAYVAAQPGCAPEPATLRNALRQMLPEYMLPAQIMVLPSLPMTTNGKIDRDALPATPAERAGEALQPPESATERTLAAIWAEVLGLQQVGLDDDFFALGGHSMSTVAVATRISAQLQREVPVALLFAHPVLADAAAAIDAALAPGNLVLLREAALANAVPLVCVHALGGSIAPYRELAAAMPPGVRVFGLQSNEAIGQDGRFASVTAMAEAYAGVLIQAFPAGGVRLLGWSSGGLSALALAQALAARGHAPLSVALLDSVLIPASAATDALRQAIGLTAAQRLHGRTVDDMAALLEQAVNAYKHGVEAMVRMAATLDWPLSVDEAAHWAQDIATTEHHLTLLAGYRPAACSAPVTAFRAQAADPLEAAAERPHAGREVLVAGNHFSMLQAPHVAALAAALSHCI